MTSLSRSGLAWPGWALSSRLCQLWALCYRPFEVERALVSWGPLCGRVGWAWVGPERALFFLRNKKKSERGRRGI